MLLPSLPLSSFVFKKHLISSSVPSNPTQCPLESPALSRTLWFLARAVELGRELEGTNWPRSVTALTSASLQPAPPRGQLKHSSTSLFRPPLALVHLVVQSVVALFQAELVLYRPEDRQSWAQWPDSGEAVQICIWTEV